MSIDQMPSATFQPVIWQELPSVLVHQKGDLPPVPAVYFAASDNRLLYVGKSIDIRARWSSHHKLDDLWLLAGARIYWLEVEDADSLNALERQYIEHHRPPLNSVAPLPQEQSGKLSIAPIRQATLDDFENWHLNLRQQRRTLKRYHVMQAIMEAVLESPTVQAEVISRLK